MYSVICKNCDEPIVTTALITDPEVRTIVRHIKDCWKEDPFPAGHLDPRPEDPHLRDVMGCVKVILTDHAT